MIVALKFVPPGVDVVASFRKTSGSNLRRSNSSSSKKGSLLILVKEAKNLLTPKGSGTPDPFVKWYFFVFVFTTRLPICNTRPFEVHNFKFVSRLERVYVSSIFDFSDKFHYVL
jgi:hypothetical protein